MDDWLYFNQLDFLITLPVLPATYKPNSQSKFISQFEAVTTKGFRSNKNILEFSNMIFPKIKYRYKSCKNIPNLSSQKIRSEVFPA